MKLTHSRLLVLSNEKVTNIQDKELEIIEIDMINISNLSYSCQKTAKYSSVEANYQSTDDAEIKSVKIGDGEPIQKLSYLYADQVTAEATAQKVYNDSSLDNDTLSITKVGDPDIISGVPIKINGLRDDIYPKSCI